MATHGVGVTFGDLSVHVMLLVLQSGIREGSVELPGEVVLILKKQLT